MVNKNKVDDYYSNISKKDDKEEKKSIKPRKKIIIKKSKIVKKDNKSTPKDTDSKKTTFNKVKKETKTNKKVLDFSASKKEVKVKEKTNDKQKKSKWIIQDIKVVKRDSEDYRKDSKGKTNKKPWIWETKNYVERWSKTNQNKNWKNNSAPSKTKKDFTEENKRKKWWFKHKNKTRGKFSFMEEEKVFTRSKVSKQTKKEEKKVEDIKQNIVEKKWETVIIWDFIQLKEFSEKIWAPLPKLIAEFMKNGMMVNINSKIDFDSASIIAEAFEVKLKRDDSAWASVEDIMIWDISSFLAEDDASLLEPRAPVISIMGHVDHWKTSLLDYIRKAKVASGEAWWITQSIWAYQVELEQGKITFLDTPWHEAFTVMRARWAKSTDIAILVVAADEWVKPQTIESISHAKEASIPVIVAINKMDKEWANPDHVKGQLAEHWLTPEDWGGDTPMVPVSAHSGFGIDDLLEIILLVAEMKELKANPNRKAVATVIESHLDSSLWPVATVLINTWTINKWDNIVCSDSYWKVKILRNYMWEKIKLATPSEPVLIVWLNNVVEGWDILQVVSSWDKAKTKSLEYKQILEKQKRESATGLDLLMSKIKAWNLKQLKIILKSDTNGSLEAIKASLLKLSTEETSVSIIHGWVWPITEWDILMWEWSEAILVWFNVWVLPTAKGSLETSKVEFISSDIIYHITEKIEKIITWMLDPKEVEIVLWKAKVLEIFFTDKKFMIVWLNLPDWKIEKKAKIRVFRNKKYIWAWVVDSLKQWTLDVKEVEWPLECGIKYVWNVKLEPKDELEFYKIEIQK